MKIFKQRKNGLLYMSKDDEYKFFNIKTGISGLASYDLRKARASYAKRKLEKWLELGRKDSNL